MAAPLWACGVRTLRDLLHQGTGDLLTWQHFHIRHPEAGQLQQTALQKTTDLLCNVPGMPATTGALVPLHLLPTAHPLPSSTGKLRYMRVERCVATRGTEDNLEFLVRWVPSTALPHAAFLELQAMGCVARAISPEPPAPSYTVTWHDSWESAESMQVPFAFHTAAIARELLCASLRRDQPIDTKLATPPIPIPPDALTVDFDEANPDVDVLPSGAPMVVVEADTAWCFTSEGRCVASLPSHLLDALHLDYASAGGNAADTLGFTSAVVALTHDYFQWYATKLPPRHHDMDSLSIPAEVQHELALAFSLQVHWSTTPLTRLRLLPRYTASKPTATPFGGVCDSVGHRFVGQAGLMVVPETEAAAACALKWALLSTYTDLPTLTVLLLPAIPSKGYNRYIGHPRVHKLCTVQRQCLHSTRLQPTGTTTTRTAKWDAHVLVVANAVGSASTGNHPGATCFVVRCVGVGTCKSHLQLACLLGWRPSSPSLQANARSRLKLTSELSPFLLARSLPCCRPPPWQPRPS